MHALSDRLKDPTYTPRFPRPNPMIPRLSGVRFPLAALVLAACARTPAPRLSPASAVRPALESRVVSGPAARDVSFDTMMSSIGNADVVFFGEQHDDPATHRAELAVLAALGNGRRPVVLSLEMFERDVQGVLDDYLRGAISEADFLARSRPWERYTTDYRALVELARARGWRVIASNVPRRLASAVSRRGLAVLDTMLASDRALVAREILCPRDRYYERFTQQMGGHGAPSSTSPGDSTATRAMTNRFYEAQCIKDETMAESVVSALEAEGEGAVVLHVDGAFHSDFGLGTAERVRRRRPGSTTVVISAIPVADLSTAPVAEHAGKGDFLFFVRRPPPAAKATSPARR